MQIPTKIKLGNQQYHINKTKLPRGVRGQVYPVMGLIEMATDEPYVYWHELTHAILYEMNSDLWRDEKFVTQFSKLLTQSIKTAKFNGKT